MRVAVAQIDARPDDPQANARLLAGWTARAAEAGCAAAVFPEMIDTGYTMDSIRAHAAADDGPVFQVASAAARTHGLTVVAGLSQRTGEGIFNTATVFGPDGAVRARYRKTHLAVVVGEQKVIRPGDQLVHFELGGMTWGLMICYDLRYPELARALTNAGAQGLIVLSAWPFPRVSHWRTLLSARAIENQVYVAAANRVGTDGDQVFCGSSAVIDPYGVIEASASENHERLITAEIDPARVQQVRQFMPALEGQRPELYK